MKVKILATLIFVLIAVISSAHAYGTASIVSEVYGLGNYTNISNPTLQPGDTVKLYVEADKVDHAGFVAVNFYMIIYNSNLQIKDVLTSNVRYRYNVRDVYITPEFTIPDTWESGQYFIKVYAYDVADEAKVRQMYARALDRFEPDYLAAKSFTSQPEGVNVGGYSGYLKKQSLWNYILAQNLQFKVVNKITKKAGLVPQKAIVHYPINVTYYIGKQQLSKPRFLSNYPFTFNFTSTRAIHDGVVALDYLFIITNNKNEPVYYAQSSERYINYNGTAISHAFIHQLPVGKYYLLVKIYDRANPEPLKEFLNSLGTYSEAYNLNKINAYRTIKQGSNVNSGLYSTLGILKPVSENNLVYFDRIPFEVSPEVKEENITQPLINYLAIKPSNFIVNLSQPFTINVKLRNSGKEGTVFIKMLLRGEKKGYMLTQSTFVKPDSVKTVTFNISLPLTVGAWKISLENSSLNEVILVQKSRVIRQAENQAAEQAALFAPTKIQKPKTPILIIGFLIATLIAILMLLKRKYGDVPPEFELPVKITLATLILLIILYIIYLYK
ncbi:MAG TPA: hypothetical protein ENH28_03170 [Euryarchaeota archaeon]|nr:hypothetical protein BMS3Bbin15_01090 [archaeon BMS3Bbin15]HDL15143.1 hypothetical protein [Euryarchaeota archaeon]